MNFESLKSQSSKIAKLLDEDQTISMNKGISELIQVIGSAAQSKSSFSLDSLQNGSKLLANKNFDVESYSNQVQNLEFSQNLDSDKLSEIELEGFLSYHHDMIIFSAVNDVRKSSALDVKKSYNRWAVEEWKSSKRKFMESFGNKQLSSTEDEQQKTQKQLYQPIRTFFSIDESKVISKDLPLLQKLHVKVVNSIASEITAKSYIQSIPIRPASELLLILSKFTDEKNMNDINSYKTILEMLVAIAGEDVNDVRPCGFFANICFDSNGFCDEKYLITSNLKSYFENQISLVWNKRYIDSGAAIQSTSSTSFQSSRAQSKINFLRNYVARLHRIHSTLHAKTLISIQNYNETLIVPLWVLVYHCIRSGEVLLAIQELEMALEIGTDDIEDVKIFKDFLLLLRNSQRDPKNVKDRNSLRNSMMKVADIFHRLNQDQHVDVDPYKEYLANILSLCDYRFASSSPVVNSIEDFLWTNLWFEENSIFLDVPTADTFSRILEIGGSEYFDPTGSTPFVYAMVLISCHRFGDAVAYLWQTNKLIQSIHVMVICLYYGLVLPQNLLSCNPPHRFQNQSMLKESWLMEDLFPSNILLSYLDANFNDSFPQISIYYLALLKTPWGKFVSHQHDVEVLNAHVLKCDIIIFDAFKSFLVSLDNSSLKTILSCSENKTSLLSQCFDDQKMERLFYLVASEKLSKKRDARGAVFVYEVAGLLSEALIEICNQLVHTMCFPGDEIDFWRQETIRFLENHQIDDSLKQYLELRNQSYLESNVDDLIQLALFFQLSSSFGNAEEALKIIRSLGLLASNEREIHSVSERFLFTNQFLLRLIDDVLLMAAETILSLWSQVHNESVQNDFSGVLSKQKLQGKLLKDNMRCLLRLIPLVRNKFLRRDTENIIESIANKMI